MEVVPPPLLPYQYSLLRHTNPMMQQQTEKMEQTQGISYGGFLKPSQPKKQLPLLMRTTCNLEIIRYATVNSSIKPPICSTRQIFICKSDIYQLRKVSANHCDIKRECIIGLIENRHVLIKLTVLEDYMRMLSTPAYYLKVQNKYWQIRHLKWDPRFKSDEETSCDRLDQFSRPTTQLLFKESCFLASICDRETFGSRHGYQESN